jgi:hypothetical protein
LRDFPAFAISDGAVLGWFFLEFDITFKSERGQVIVRDPLDGRDTPSPNPKRA